MFSKWYPAIKHKLKAHICYLITDYSISSCSVEDIFNEVMAKMIAMENKGSKISSPLAYAKTIAKNLVIKLSKKQYRDRGMELALTQNQLHSIDCFDELHENDDWLCRTLSAFQDEYPRDHQLLCLKYLEGLNYIQISEIFGLTSDATRQACRRAKNKLISFIKTGVS